MRRILPALLLAVAAQSTFAQSRAWEDTVTLPTWVEGAPDIHPKIDALDPGASYYPYTGRTNFGKTREPQSWRRLNLENEYLSCSFLPDLGGHLYSCTDKRNGHPLFRPAESVKKADVGPRGAWVAMGIEFNFPVAHSRYAVSPVDFGLRQEKDHAEVWLGDTDCVTGMRWIAEFILRDRSAALEQRVTLSNPTAERHPYLWWANADIDLDAGTRFVYPANVMATHGLTELHAWPREKNGVDLSTPSGVKDMIGLFAYGSREPYFAAYNTGSRTAVVHVANPAVVAGKKLFHWGASGLNWARQNLSDSNSGYVEIQAGLFENQGTHEYLQPSEQIQFTELWMAGRELNGVSRANEHAILSLERLAGAGKNELITQVNVTHDIPGARLALYSDATVAWQDTADLTPSRTYERVFPDPGKSIAYRFELRNSSGALLMSHTEGSYEAAPAASLKLGPQPPRGPGTRRASVADYLAMGEFNERASQYRFAEGEYRGGLAKYPKDLQLKKALGRLLVGQRRYAEAAQLLSEACQKLFLDPELLYYLGVALAYSGKEDDARKSWSVAAKDAKFGPPALVELASLEARSGHAASALDLARKAIERQPSSRALGLEAALLRHAGRTEEARKQVDEGLALDPLDAFLRLETIRLGGKDDGLWSHLAANPERVLDLVDSYLEFGLYSDALELLSRQYETVPSNQREPGEPALQANALVSYYRAYCRKKLGLDATADLKLAALQPLEYVFPHRASSSVVLAAARENDPKDASAVFLTALLDLDENRVTEAVDAFKAALAIRKDIPGIDYLLGRSLLLLGDQKAEALAILRQSAASNPSDKALKLAIDAAARPSPDPRPDSTSTSAAAALAASKGTPAPKTPATPAEFAQTALAKTAEGESAESMFNRRTFPEEKQPPEVLQAYIEVQLQALRRSAAKKDCATVRTEMERLGREDKNLPFTLQGFDAFMKSARFQYYVGAVESLCGLSRDARRRWAEVAKMAPDIASPDFAFSFVAAQNLKQGVDLRPLLDKVGRALDAADNESKGMLYYSKGILLLAKGDEREAIAAFAEGVKAPDREFAHYLNQSALVEASRAGPGK